MLQESPSSKTQVRILGYRHKLSLLECTGPLWWAQKGGWQTSSRLYVWGHHVISRGSMCTLSDVFQKNALLYELEIWAIPQQQLHRLEVIQVRCLRKAPHPSCIIILRWMGHAKQELQRAERVMIGDRLRRQIHHARRCRAAAPTHHDKAFPQPRAQW